MAFQIEEEAPATASKYVIEDDEPAVVSGGKRLNQLPRQLGLGTRSTATGAAEGLGIVTEPIRNFITDPLLGLLTGNGLGYKSQPLAATVSQGADAAGMPTPENAGERVFDSINRTGGAAATMYGGAGMLSRILGEAATAVPAAGNRVMQSIRDFGNASKAVPAGLTAQPAVQAGAVLGSGAAGGMSKEAGGSPVEQFMASLAGGVAGGGAVAGTQALGNFVASQVRGLRLTPTEIDSQISGILAQDGYDYAGVPERARQALRAEVKAALRTGREVSPEALSRRADFAVVGATPTRSMVSQNPVQVTREQNLAKIGANTNDAGLTGLAEVQNRNNARFIGMLDERGGAAPDAQYRAGQTLADRITGTAASRDANVGALYDAVKQQNGGAGGVQLSAKNMIDAAHARLNADDAIGFLPEKVGSLLNTYSSGQQELTPQRLGTLLKVISREEGKAARAGDGNAGHALKLLRESIIETPLDPVKPSFGGNQLVTQATANQMQQADAAIPAYMDSVNTARGAARDNFRWRESSRPVEQVLNGAQPDNLFQQVFLRGSRADAQAVVNEMGGPVGAGVPPPAAGRGMVPSAGAPTGLDQVQTAAQRTQALEPMRQATMSYLRDAALRPGTAAETGRFNQVQYNKTLAQIGDEKLRLLFAPEELREMKALGRVSALAVHQPAGSAVNNSNTAAAAGQGTMALLDKILAKTPVAGPMFRGPVNSWRISAGNREALNSYPGLMEEIARDPLIPRMLLPALAASQAAQQR